MIVYCKECLDMANHPYINENMGYMAYCVPCGGLQQFCSKKELLKSYRKTIVNTMKLLARARKLPDPEEREPE